MGNFRELKVWQESKDLAVEIYKLIDGNPKLNNDFRLRGQMTGSAISIASNIAEGDELKTVKQGINFLYIAKGSCAELITQVIIAQEIGRLPEKDAKRVLDKCEKISVMLYRLIEARKKFL